MGEDMETINLKGGPQNEAAIAEIRICNIHTKIC